MGKRNVVDQKKKKKMPSLFVCVCPKSSPKHADFDKPNALFLFLTGSLQLLTLVFELSVFADATHSLALEFLVRPKESCQILYHHKQTSSKNVPVKVVWNTHPHERNVAQEAISIAIEQCSR